MKSTWPWKPLWWPQRHPKSIDPSCRSSTLGKHWDGPPRQMNSSCYGFGLGTLTRQSWTGHRWVIGLFCPSMTILKDNHGPLFPGSHAFSQFSRPYQSGSEKMHLEPFPEEKIFPFQPAAELSKPTSSLSLTELRLNCAFSWQGIFPKGSRSKSA